MKNWRRAFNTKQILVADLMQYRLTRAKKSINTISINQSEEEYTYFEDRFICLSKIFVDFRNRWNKEYLFQLGEHFKKG